MSGDKVQSLPGLCFCRATKVQSLPGLCICLAAKVQSLPTLCYLQRRKCNPSQHYAFVRQRRCNPCRHYAVVRQRRCNPCQHCAVSMQKEHNPGKDCTFPPVEASFGFKIAQSSLFIGPMTYSTPFPMENFSPPRSRPGFCPKNKAHFEQFARFRQNFSPFRSNFDQKFGDVSIFDYLCTRLTRAHTRTEHKSFLSYTDTK